MSRVISDTAHQLRTSIERAKAAKADIPWLERFPDRCCNFAANLLLLALSDAGISQVRRMMGTVVDDRGNDVASHVWVQADQLVVDITADGYGQETVIAEETSAWHSSLSEIKPFIERIDVEEGVSADQMDRLRNLYQDTLSVLAEFADEPQ